MTIDLPMEIIEQKYLAGISAAALAKEYSVNYTTIIAKLRKRGTKIRTVSEAAKSPVKAAILSEMKKGTSPWNKGKTLETEPRLLPIVNFLKNRVISAKTRAKLSASKSKGRVFYDFCQECGQPKGHSVRLRCVHCFLANRDMQKELTKAEKKIEGILQFMFQGCNPYTYNGSGKSKQWITLYGRKKRRPDFINEREKKVIEIFGRYWHRNDNEERIIQQYRNVGWDCLIIWEDFGFGIRDRILEFTYPFEFEAEWKEEFVCA